MSQLEFFQFEKKIESPLDKGIFLFYGSESFLIKDCVDKLQQKFIPEGLADFNVDRIQGHSLQPGPLRDHLFLLPAFSQNRLVVIENASAIPDKCWEDMLKSIKQMPSTTLLVLVFKAIDKRKKLFKTLSPISYFVELKSPYENKVPLWIQYFSKKYELKLSIPAVRLFHERVGSSLVDLDESMRSLKALVKNPSQITPEDVKKYVAKRRVESVFDLINALGAGDLPSSLIFMAKLLDQGQSELGVVALMARHFRILLMIKESQGMSFKHLTTKVGVPSYFLSEYMSQSKKWTLKKLERVFSLMVETDRAIKSSPLSSSLWLENLVFQVSYLKSDNMSASSKIMRP